MDMKVAEDEKIRHANLQDKVLVHKKFKKRMQVLDLRVNEIIPASGIYKVICRMRGELGEIDEPLDEVLKNYTA